MPRTAKRKTPAPSTTAKRRSDAGDEDDATEVSPPAKGKRNARRSDDDEPKPKAKKKSKKKPAGPPLMLFVLIGIGALVLIGGGFGIYFGFIEDSKPTAASGTLGGPGVPSVAAAPAALTTGWVDIHEEGGRYRMKFPSQPKKEIKTEDSPPFGQLERTSYESGAGGETFTSAHTLLPQERMGLTDEQVLDAIVEDGKKELVAKKLALKDIRSVKHLGFPARSFTLQIPTGKNNQMANIAALVIIAKDRIIVLTSMGMDASAHTPRAKAFIDSLKIE